jgi:hypothetical protein
LGNVRNIRTGRILKQRGDKYSRINLSAKKGVPVTQQIHRLVAEAFWGEIPKGMHVDHLDRNSLNNKLSNLKIVTPKENMNNRIMLSENIPHIIYNSYTKTFKVNGDDVKDIGEALNKFKKSI